jgi:glycosyltransferase involved in cell wall biosynthesis
MSPQPLRINYLLEDAGLFGGVKVPLHHANLLHDRGHEVRIVCRGDRPDWYSVDARFVTVDAFTADQVPDADVHVATFWTTVEPASRLPGGQAVHYCQGFEGDLTHNISEHPKILAAYGLPLPTFAVSPHLAELVRSRFNRRVRVVPAALEPWTKPKRRIGPHRRPRILVPSPFENYVKGVPVALEAIRRIRDAGLQVQVVRVSQWAMTESERELAEPDEYHLAMAPAEVARLMAGCDLLMAPSTGQEGFNLWVLEAMACGLPVVASRIDAHLGFAGGAAELVPHDDDEAFSEAALEILTTPVRWRRMRKAGLKAAEPFSRARVADQVEEAVHWAAGDWRGGS